MNRGSEREGHSFGQRVIPWRPVSPGKVTCMKDYLQAEDAANLLNVSEHWLRNNIGPDHFEPYQMELAGQSITCRKKFWSYDVIVKLKNLAMKNDWDNGRETPYISGLKKRWNKEELRKRLRISMNLDDEESD